MSRKQGHSRARVSTPEDLDNGDEDGEANGDGGGFFLLAHLCCHGCIVMCDLQSVWVESAEEGSSVGYWVPNLSFGGFLGLEFHVFLGYGIFFGVDGVLLMSLSVWSLSLGCVSSSLDSCSGLQDIEHCLLLFLPNWGDTLFLSSLAGFMKKGYVWPW